MANKKLEFIDALEALLYEWWDGEWGYNYDDEGDGLAISLYVGNSFGTKHLQRRNMDKNYCPQCNGTNLNEDKTICFDCDSGEHDSDGMYDDMYDDAQALASAGFGTDEDYGSYESDPWE